MKFIETHCSPQAKKQKTKTKNHTSMNFCISVPLDEWKYLEPNKGSTGIEVATSSDLLEGFFKKKKKSKGGIFSV